MIKRTAYANTPRAAAWVGGYWDQAFPFADIGIEADLPTHSPILGPDGSPLKYEPRPTMGFDLRASQGQTDA